MAKRSSSVSLLIMTLRRAATWRAKGLPGPPGLPLAKRPLASWPLVAGVCAAGSVGRGLDIGGSPQGVPQKVNRDEGRALPLSLLFARVRGGGRSVGYARLCHRIQSAPRPETNNAKRTRYRIPRSVAARFGCAGKPAASLTKFHRHDRWPALARTMT